MFMEIIRSDGLAHLSYLIGDGKEAAVIDPRRDIDIYIRASQRRGAQITHVFETHRNEDYVIGSTEIARRTGAEIYHGKQLDFKYGSPVSENDTFKLGDMRLKIFHTPGHTDESISIALYDIGFGDAPVAVFSGDVLFIGQVGRTDFYPDRAREVAGLQYDSIFSKLLPLGDQVILCPAHGAGSICGSGMASREFSTMGYERRFNPALRKTDREVFIDSKINQKTYQPPYFRQMERFNQEGPPPMEVLPVPKPCSPAAFSKLVENGAIMVDLRSPEAFSGAYIPGSYAVPLGMLPGFAGWFFDYDKDLTLVVNNYDDVKKAVRFLIRIGYDRIAGYLEGSLEEWETAGKHYGQIPSVHAGEIRKYVNEGHVLLDVREIDEWNAGHLEDAIHIYVGEIPDRLNEIPKDKPIITFCGSGRRAIIAASILKQNGFDDVKNCLGSMAACKNVGCNMVFPEEGS
ncbi:MAG: rhodanese-like domain-containing protein [Desulfobacterales bacterium]